MSAIEIAQVSKRFGGVSALSNVTVDVAAGEAVCLFGPSGCGKTTLLRLVAGLEQPDQGTVAIAGRIVAGADLFVPPAERGIAMVFQDLALWPHMRVERHVQFVLRAQGLSRAERCARVDGLLDLCGLEDKRRAYPGELSGGQQQRLGIARALATASDILLLDEPLVNLEVELGERFIREFLRLKAEEGTTILMATHVRDAAEQLADRIVFMGDGMCSTSSG